MKKLSALSIIIIIFSILGLGGAAELTTQPAATSVQDTAIMPIYETPGGLKKLTGAKLKETFVQQSDSRLSDARTPTAHTQSASTITGLSTVATTGDYGDLTGKPAIPSALSQLTDDSTHRLTTDAEKASWNGKAPAASPTFTGTVTTPVTGSTQCLHVNSSGVLSGTGADCGAGSGNVSIAASQPSPTGDALWLDTAKTATTQRLLILSDPHYNSGDSYAATRVQWVFPFADPQHVFFNGDISNNDFSDWGVAKTSFSWIRSNYPNAKLYGLMGNHDYTSLYSSSNSFYSGTSDFPVEVESIITGNVSIGNTVISVKSAQNFIVGKKVLIKAVPDVDQTDTQSASTIAAVDGVANTVTLADASTINLTANAAVVRMGKDNKRQIAKFLDLFAGTGQRATKGVVKIGNNVLISVGMDNYVAGEPIAPADLDWLENEVATYSETHNVFIFTHFQPDDGAELGGVWTGTVGGFVHQNIISRFRRIASQYKVNGWFFGHQHGLPGTNTMSSQNTALWGNTYFLHTPSLASSITGGVDDYTYGYFTIVDFVSGGTSMAVKYYRVDGSGTITLRQTVTIPLNYTVSYGADAEAKVKVGGAWSGSLFEARRLDKDAANGSTIGVSLGSGTKILGGNLDRAMTFKSLVAGTGVTLSNTGTEVTISAPGAGETATYSGAASFSSGAVTLSTTVGSSVIALSAPLTLNVGDTIYWTGNLRSITSVTSSTSYKTNLPFTAVVSGQAFTVVPFVKRLNNSDSSNLLTVTGGDSTHQGSVGIGTSTPISPLHVNDAGPGILRGIISSNFSGDTSNQSGGIIALMGARGTIEAPLTPNSSTSIGSINILPYVESTGVAAAGYKNYASIDSLISTADTASNPIKAPLVWRMQTGNYSKVPALYINSFGNVAMGRADLNSNTAATARLHVRSAFNTVFGGTAANSGKLTTNKIYTGRTVSTYRVWIDTNGTPDKFSWSFDGVTQATGVSITGSAQTLSNGVTITFSQTTGFTINDNWFIEVVPSVLRLEKSDGTMVMEIDNNGFEANGIGSTVTAAATIAPTGRVFHITGTTNISTITLPYSGFVGSIDILADTAINFVSGFNIMTTTTVPQYRGARLTCDGTNWYIHY